MEYRIKFCSDFNELQEFVRICNECKYKIITMTQKYGYTLIYKK